MYVELRRAKGGKEIFKYTVYPYIIISLPIEIYWGMQE